MKCPGQDTRYWKAEAVFDVDCPNCGQTVEFFKDETTRKCRNCGHKIINPNLDFGCASYCKFAEQCLGQLPAELVSERDELLKDRVAVEMKKHFRRDFKRIAHAVKVARHAEAICMKEGGDPAVVLSAAYLHDAGFKPAEEKYPESSAAHHEEEGIAVAREILKRLGAREELIGEVCGIVGRHHKPGENEDVNFKILYDADAIANLEEEWKNTELDDTTKSATIDSRLLTPAGRERAQQVLL